MAYFDKETYERKEAYAHRVSYESIAIIAEALGLDCDDERLEALERLSHIRHEIHSTQHPESLVTGNDDNLMRNVNLIGHQYSTGEITPLVNELHLIDDWFPTITLPELSDDDSFRYRIEYFNGTVPEDWDDDDNYDELSSLCYETEFFGCREIIDDWSDSVRRWFGKVNKKYGTKFPALGGCNE